MEDKQHLARIRNLSKAQLVKLRNDSTLEIGLTHKERSSIDIIKFHIDKLLLQWDVQSIELGLKPTKPKCSKCAINEIVNLEVSLYQAKEGDIKVFLCNNCVDLSKYNLISDEYRKSKTLG